MGGLRAAWLLLAVVIAAGVAGMHTLGHVAPHGHVAHGAHGAHLDGVAEPPVMESAADAPVQAALDVLRGLDAGLDPMVLCVAILTAFATALLLAAVLAAVRRPAACRHGAAVAGGPGGRGPPPPSLGLRIVDLSVLRI